MTIYVTSDTHFNHANILNFENGRGCDFQSVAEMNECLIDNWNDTVKPGDKVYHLGDVFFGSKDEFKSLWPKLNGSKRLVIGNHDDVKFLSAGGFFKKVMLWRVFKEWGVILSHTPQHQSALTANRSGLINIHGHTHRNGSPDGPYKSVCVELTGYKPVALEDLLP